jgi:hypothetical protein
MLFNTLGEYVVGPWVVVAVLIIRQINNVVSQAAERIDGVDVLALRFGQQSSAPEICRAVTPGQLRAAPIAFGQQGFL